MQQFQSSVQAATDGVTSLSKEAEKAIGALSLIGPWLDRSFETLLLASAYVALAFWLHWFLKLSTGQSIFLCLWGECQACACSTLWRLTKRQARS